MGVTGKQKKNDYYINKTPHVPGLIDHTVAKGPCCMSEYTDLGSHKSGFVGKTKDYVGRDAQVGCRANARPPLSRYL